MKHIREKELNKLQPNNKWEPFQFFPASLPAPLGHQRRGTCVKKVKILSCKSGGLQGFRHFILKGGGLFDFSGGFQ